MSVLKIFLLKARNYAKAYLGYFEYYKTKQEFMHRIFLHINIQYDYE